MENGNDTCHLIANVPIELYSRFTSVCRDKQIREKGKVHGAIKAGVIKAINLYLDKSEKEDDGNG